ncbi:MAG TPA: hypothetical protein VMB49_11510 [Acidobacteriaceae bacterium]|nr:hypothetical protein [Acidobacteriaceae bacterium]
MRKRREEPSFVMVVVLSAAALILIFIGACVLLGEEGVGLLPGLHHDSQPTSWLAPSASGPVSS